MRPTSIQRRDYLLHFDWEDGHHTELTISYLRRKCPCATCKGIRDQSQDGTMENREDLPSVALTHYELQGNYAIQFRFSDGHKDGIYPFEYLRSLCLCDQCKDQ